MVNDNTYILNLEWTSSYSRDRVVASLVCNYLRLLGYNVVEECVHNGFQAIDKYKPVLIFMTNSIGAKINLNLIKYARIKSIPCLTLIAEGNFTGESKSDIDQFTWGVNSDNVLYENFVLYWSQKDKDLSTHFYPELNSRIKVSGSVGTDIYKIKKPSSKSSFLTKYQKNRYNKIIGIGCWEFGILNTNDHRYKATEDFYGKTVVEKLRREEQLFNSILLQTVESNPDVLFLVKIHPGALLGEKTSGVVGLSNFENVLILKNQEPIIDVIQVSDIWLSFESTTTLEAWLMGKQTCLLNPSDFDWKRLNISNGSPIYRNLHELNNAISTYYENSELPGFSEKSDIRQSLIRELTQFSDGLNHVRVGNFIVDMLEENTLHSSLNKGIRRNQMYWFKVKQKLINRFGPCFSFIPTLKSAIKRNQMFSSEEVKYFSNELAQQQMKFYASLSLDLKRISIIDD